MNIQKNKFTCKRGSLTISGTQYKPEGNALPITIVSHQFMANQGMVKHYAKLFAELGFAAFTFDFNGGCLAIGKSSGKTTDMSVLTEVEDLYAVIDYAKSLPFTNAESITLMGCSQGGLVSAITASKRRDEISNLVLFYPALCIPDDARSGKMMMAKFDPKSIPDIIQCGPMKLGGCYAKAVINMDAYDEIKGFPKNVLIVHGNADRLVDISYSEKAAKTYIDNGNSHVQFCEVDGGGHIFSKKHDKIAIKYLKEFIIKIK